MQDQSEPGEFFHEDLRYTKARNELPFTSTVADTGLAVWRLKMQRFVAHFRSNTLLYKKYSSSQNYYYIKEVNEVLADSRTPAAIAFKQAVDFSTPGEQLKKFVDRDAYERKMRGLADYYRYHKEIPRVFAKNVYDLYFDHHDRKRKIEYVIITRNLKNSKLGEDPKKALEEKLKKQRSKKFDPMLNDLPQYSFAQRYYHHRQQDSDISKSMISVFDKLHQLVNCSKLSNQSFMIDVFPSEKALLTESDVIRDLEKNTDTDKETNKFNFLKRKKPMEVVEKEIVARTARQSESTHSPELLPHSALSTTRRQFRDQKRLELNIEEVDKKNRNTSARNENIAESQITKDQRADSRSKEEYGGVAIKGDSKNHMRSTFNSLKQSRLSENDRKRLSLERKEIESAGARNFENKTYWRSLERTVGIDEDLTSFRPKSQSKRKKKCGDTLKKSINFNFNWTKVNKMLTNPLLINKSIGPTKQGTHRDKGDPQPTKSSTLQANSKPKNYLDQKSKIVKGYHHKVNSMLMSQINQDLAKGSQEHQKSTKVKGFEKELFSRKNSLNEVDIKALFSYRAANEGSNALKPKFISHSKKNSVYNISNPTALQKKKSVGHKKKKHKKAISGFTYDLSIGKTLAGTLALSSEKDTLVKTAIFDHKKQSALSSRQHELGHKHSKSEAESLFPLKMSRLRRLGTKKLSSDLEAKKNE
jgi:hypothetical protein